AHALQRGHRRVHDVDRVGGTEGTGEHVVNARALQDGPHRAAGNDTGTGAGRLQQHAPGRVLTLHRVRDGAGDTRHPEEVLLGLLDTLGDRRGHLLGLAVTDAHHAVGVAHHDQRGEAEPAAALDHFGHPVDGDHALEVGGLLVGPATTTIVAAVPP